MRSAPTQPRSQHMRAAAAREWHGRRLPSGSSCDGRCSGAQRPPPGSSPDEGAKCGGSRGSCGYHAVLCVPLDHGRLARVGAKPFGQGVASAMSFPQRFARQPDCLPATAIFVPKADTDGLFGFGFDVADNHRSADCAMARCCADEDRNRCHRCSPGFGLARPSSARPLQSWTC